MGQLDDLAGFVLFCFSVFLECSGSWSWSCGCPGVMPVLNLDIIICIIVIHIITLCRSYYDLCTREDERRRCA